MFTIKILVSNALQFMAGILSPRSRKQALDLLIQAQQQPQQQPQQHVMGHGNSLDQAQMQCNSVPVSVGAAPLMLRQPPPHSAAAAPLLPPQVHSSTQAPTMPQLPLQHLPHCQHTETQQLRLTHPAQPLKGQQQQQQQQQHVVQPSSPGLPLGPLCCDDLDWQPSSRKNSNALVAHIPADRLDDFLTGEGRAGHCSFWVDGKHDHSAKGPPAIVRIDSTRFTADYHCCFGPQDLLRGHTTHKGDANAAALG